MPCSTVYLEGIVASSASQPQLDKLSAKMFSDLDQKGTVDGSGLKQTNWNPRKRICMDRILFSVSNSWVGAEEWVLRSVLKTFSKM